MAAVIAAGITAAHAVAWAAGPAPRPITVAIDAAAQVEPWRAAAMQRLVEIDVDGDRRVEVVAADRGAELAVVGTVDARRLRLEMRGGERPASASIAITDTDAITLRRAIRAMMDQALRPADAGEDGAGPAHIGAADASVLGLLAVWLALLVILALPFGFGVWLLGKAQLARIVATRSFRRAAAIAAGALLAAITLAVAGDEVPAASPLVYIAAGLAWSWFGVATARVVFPAFPGFERVEHGDVFRLARAWSLVALQRMARTALYDAPFVAVLWLGCHLLDVPLVIAVALVAPLWGLVARFWFTALVDVAALYLDDQLVEGAASAEDPWHAVVRGYFMGYVRRAGWTADDRLLDDILFLPGDDQTLCAYGGGGTHARVVIGRPMLEYALAPYGRPHDYAGPRISKLHWSEWNAGLVVPVEIKGTLATPEQRQPMYATVPGETDWEPLGEPPTLAGIVEPDKLDKRDQHRPHEDPLWLDWDPGDEHDGTDASDKDYVFGGLVHALGAIRRRDTELATLGMALERRLRGGPGFLRAAFARARSWTDRLLSRYPAIVGDAYCALNFARHHLMQYLAWRAWGREDLLTARAHAPELERMSGEILRELDQQAEDTGPASRATPHRRMAWLSAFYREPVHSRRTVIARRLAMAGALLALVAVTAVGIARAVDYHPTYVDRIEAEKQALRGSPHEQE